MENCTLPARIYLPGAGGVRISASVTPSHRRLRSQTPSGGPAAWDETLGQKGESADLHPEGADHRLPPRQHPTGLPRSFPLPRGGNVARVALPALAGVEDGG